MGLNYDAPFIGNTPDDQHCLQAAHMMIAKFFIPDFKISWEEWDQLTGYEEGKGTWASTGLLWFRNQDFEVEHWSLFDYAAFIREGRDYLLKIAGRFLRANWMVMKSWRWPLAVNLGKKPGSSRQKVR